MFICHVAYIYRKFAPDPGAMLPSETIHPSQCIFEFRDVGCYIQIDCSKEDVCGIRAVDVPPLLVIGLTQLAIDLYRFL